MVKAYVLINITPPALALRFEHLGRAFPFVLTDLKQSCPYLHWDKDAKAWRGSTAHFVDTLQCCLRHFENDAIIIVWGQSNTGHRSRQLSLF